VKYTTSCCIDLIAQLGCFLVLHLPYATPCSYLLLFQCLICVVDPVLPVDWCALQFGSWIFTLFVSGLGTAAVFAYGVYAPGKIEGAQVIYHEDQVLEGEGG
jgi:hypothetical protein